MAAFARDPLDIIRRLKAAHPELADDAKVGLVASFCKGTVLKAATGTNPPEIVATLTTDDLDLDDEIVMPRGIDFDSYFLKNRNYFADHEYDMTHVVGKVRNVKVMDHAVIVRVAMVNLDSPYTRAVMALAEADSCPSSIGYKDPVYGHPEGEAETKRYGKSASLIRSCVAIEGSFTAMPCNVRCQSQGIIYPDEEKSEERRGILVKARIPERVIDSMVPRKARRVLVVD